MRLSSAPLALPLLVFTLAAVCLAILTPSLIAGVNPPGYPPFRAKEYQPAGLGPKEPEVTVLYPGGATNRGIRKGSAVVSVMIDADNKATDFLVVGCSDQVFGTALLTEAKLLKYQAAKFKGVAVPARFNLGYTFMPDSKSVSMNPMDAARLQLDQGDHSKLAYTAVAESALDHPPEFTEAFLPRLPAGYQVAGKDPVKVFVTFYIDEEGHVRAPHVESATSPLLIPGAIEAVLKWSFKPPLVKGKPALVFAGRAVGFIPPKE